VIIAEEEVVPREGCVGFEGVVRVESAFRAEDRAKDGSEGRCLGRGITADGHLPGDNVTVFYDTDGSE
jgi:hypothetical protein